MLRLGGFVKSSVRSSFRLHARAVRQTSTVASSAPPSSPPPPPLSLVNPPRIDSNRGASDSDATDYQTRTLRRIYAIAIGTFGFLILDYLNSSVAAGTSVYTAEEMRLLHRQIAQASQDSQSEALRSDLLALTEMQKRQYELMRAEAEKLSTEVRGLKEALTVKPHVSSWRASVEEMLDQNGASTQEKTR